MVIEMHQYEEVCCAVSRRHACHRRSLACSLRYRPTIWTWPTTVYVWQLWWLRRVFGLKRCWLITEQSWLSFKCHVTPSRQWPCTSCPSHSFGVTITCNLQHRLVVWTLELWEQTDPLPLCSRLYLYLHDRNHNTWIGCKFSVKEIDKPYDKNGRVYCYCMKQLGILHIYEKREKTKIV